MIWPVSFLVAFVVTLFHSKSIYREKYIDIKHIEDTNSFEFFLESDRKKREKDKMMAVISIISIPLSLCLTVLIVVNL